jgi:hypothetical protein
MPVRRRRSRLSARLSRLWVIPVIAIKLQVHKPPERPQVSGHFILLSGLSLLFRSVELNLNKIKYLKFSILWHAFCNTSGNTEEEGDHERHSENKCQAATLALVVPEIDRVGVCDRFVIVVAGIAEPRSAREYPPRRI